MIEQLSDQLKKEFPDVLIVYDLNQDSHFALFGFECPNEWFQLFYHAFDQVQQRGQFYPGNTLNIQQLSWQTTTIVEASNIVG